MPWGDSGRKKNDDQTPSAFKKLFENAQKAAKAIERDDFKDEVMEALRSENIRLTEENQKILDVAAATARALRDAQDKIDQLQRRLDDVTCGP